MTEVCAGTQAFMAAVIVAWLGMYLGARVLLWWADLPEANWRISVRGLWYVIPIAPGLGFILHSQRSRATVFASREDAEHERKRLIDGGNLPEDVQLHRTEER